MLSCILYVFMFLNKAVVGSGSKGAPKYAWGGCDIRGIFRVLIAFSSHVHAPSDMLPRQITHTLSYNAVM